MYITRAAATFADLAQQQGNKVELQNQSQQNIISNCPMQPVHSSLILQSSNSSCPFVSLRRQASTECDTPCLTHASWFTSRREGLKDRPQTSRSRRKRSSSWRNSSIRLVNSFFVVFCIPWNLSIKPEILCFKIYVRHTGKDLSYIEDNMERDKFMSPKEAMDFGLVDRILEHPPRQGWIYLL